MFFSGAVCYYSCAAVLVPAGVVGGTAALAALGFTPTGVVAGSFAAWWMSWYGGNVAAGGVLAALQSTGATGGSYWFGGPALPICKKLCYDWMIFNDEDDGSESVPFLVLRFS